MAILKNFLSVHDMKISKNLILLVLDHSIRNLQNQAIFTTEL